MHPELPEPDLAHDRRRPPHPPGRDRRRARPVDRRGRSIRGAALQRRRSRSIAAHEAAAGRTVAVSSLSKVLAPGLRIGWLSAPAALRARSSSPSRPPTCTRRPSTSSRPPLPHAGRPGRAHRPAARRLSGAPGRDARRPARGARAGARFNRPDGGMFLWARLGGARTPRRSCARHSSTTSPSSRELRSTREAGTADAAAVLHDPSPTRSSSGWAAWPRRCSARG